MKSVKRLFLHEIREEIISSRFLPCVSLVHYYFFPDVSEHVITMTQKEHKRREEKKRGVCWGIACESRRERAKKQATTHNNTPHKKHILAAHTIVSISPPMADTDTRVKPWGKVNKAALHKLVVDGQVDIEDLSYENIDRVRAQYFPHHDRVNFRRNFATFASSFDLEQGLEGACRES
jgi:hypothetical protein